MRRGAAFLLALIALAASGEEEPRPTAFVSPAGAMTIRLPAIVLRSKEVKQQLTSGLTTVFVISVTAGVRGEVTKGGARIDVRYELWEEKYLVAFIDPSGKEHKLTFGTDTALALWWSENPLIVNPSRQFNGPVDVQVTLKMLPFSSQEQADTQRWLSRTLSASRGSSGEQTSAKSSDILRIIVETSIRRRPLLEYRWFVRAKQEAHR